MNTWTKQRDEIGFVHMLAVDSHHVIKVEKSKGGDYFVTAMQNDDASGGAVEYFPSLASARQFAEQAAIDGSWIDYLPE